MQVINCSNYTAQREWAAIQAAQTIVAQPLTRPTGFLATLGWWFGGRSQAIQVRNATAAAQMNEAARFGKGRLGEEAFIRCLAGQLPDSHWIMLHGYQSPGQRSDIDGVLVGPYGVTIFEVKALSGFFSLKGDTWMYQRSPRSAPSVATAQPTQQVIGNLERVRRFLDKRGLSWVPVQPVVAFCEDKAQVTTPRRQPLTVPIYRYRTPTLFRPGASIVPFVSLSARSLTEEHVVQVVNVLLGADPSARR